MIVFFCTLPIELWLNFLFLCLKVYELTLHYTQHWDHNVVTAALELLQQMFRTPPPELLHMLITASSIQHGTVFRQDTESRARSGSILELIGKTFCSFCTTKCGHCSGLLSHHEGCQYVFKNLLTY